MKRTLFILISMFIAGSMLLAACTPAPTTATAPPPSAATQPPAKPTLPSVPTLPQTTAPIDVTFWHAYGTGSAEETALTAVLAQAAIDLPQYRINVLQVPFNDIYNKYTTDVAAGGGPDMFVAPNDNLGDESRASLIADITDLVAGKLGDYAPLSVDGMTVDGKIFGVPESLKAVVFWYNKSMLATPPATTDELLALMKAGTPITISDSCYHVWGFYGSFGGQIFDSSWKVVAGQGIVDAMTWLNEVYQIEKAKGWPKTDSDGLAPFQEGTIAAITNGNWAMGDYQTALGDNLAMAPLPAGPGGVASPMLGVDGYYINPNSTNKEAAIAVALYLTGATSELKMMEAGHVPAITTATITNPLLQGLSEAFKNGYVRPQVTQLGLYWSNFCGPDQVYEKGVKPADWVAAAVAAANK
jgi:arabinogalactan oligomer/maltooligosaccharide transport system substrate-binding protein